MSTPKYTSGPWELRARGSTDYYDLVSNPYPHTKPPEFISKISGQSEANAQLISRAPEMERTLAFILEAALHAHKYPPQDFRAFTTMLIRKIESLNIDTLKEVKSETE